MSIKNDISYKSIWMDSPERYGVISRVFHWSMAYLLLWQFFGITIWRVFGKKDWVVFITQFGPYHGTVGLCVVSLVILRAIWAVINRNRRPLHHGWAGRIAVMVHGAFYALMFAIPALALLRAYGNGKGWQPWIVETGVEITWMVALANALHSPLSWILYALIIGHIMAVIAHRCLLRDRILSRMAGPLANAERHASTAPPP